MGRGSGMLVTVVGIVLMPIGPDLAPLLIYSGVFDGHGSNALFAV